MRCQIEQRQLKYYSEDNCPSVLSVCAPKEIKENECQIVNHCHSNRKCEDEKHKRRPITRPKEDYKQSPGTHWIFFLWYGSSHVFLMHPF
mmetsp:Transcript_372/g.814  ORF Transcript_372/g.814 Transcript_372/m.814 type:complete len:90 (-) Transcript_372:774-1043(-)